MVIRIAGVLLCNAMASWLLKWGSLTLVTSTLLLGSTTDATAQSDTERAGARAAAEAGLSAYNSGKYAEALDLLTRAESLVHALPHLLYMARASEKLGQLVQARELYLKIGREQLIAGAPRAFIEAQQSAQQELAAVEGRLPYLTVTVEGARANEVKITMDDREIPSVLIGVPFPVDPGNHVVMMTSAMGQRGEPVKVTMSEGKRERVTLKPAAAGAAAPAVVPAASAPGMAATPAGSSAPPAATNTGTSSNPSVDNGVKDKSGGGAPVLAYSLLGVGAVGAAVGTVFLLQRGSKSSDADKAFDACKTQACDLAQRDNISQLDKDAAKAGTLSLVGFGVGAAALTAGLYLLFTGDSKSTAALQSQKFVAYVGPTQVGATLRF